MTNYEKICAIINAGHIAQVEYNGWNFQLFNIIKSNWCLSPSSLQESALLCIDKLCERTVWMWINTYDIKSISVYQRPLWYPKEWDLVTILDTIKDSPWYTDINPPLKEMIGWPFEVRSLIDCYCVLNNKDNTRKLCVDYRHLVPYLWEDKEDISWKEVTVTIDGKEYKAIIQ